MFDWEEDEDEPAQEARKQMNVYMDSSNLPPPGISTLFLI
jgi:hypothetical protein